MCFPKQKHISKDGSEDLQFEKLIRIVNPTTIRNGLSVFLNQAGNGFCSTCFSTSETRAFPDKKGCP
jgi:hypothetical protein